MDPRTRIRQAATSGEYSITGHALAEADKDGISMDGIEGTMQWGIRRKVERRPHGVVRHTLCRGSIFVAVEITQDGQIIVVTTGRDR